MKKNRLIIAIKCKYAYVLKGKIHITEEYFESDEEFLKQYIKCKVYVPITDTNKYFPIKEAK
jgi:hypothetical protein